jgi:hypothetical protein
MFSPLPRNKRAKNPYEVAGEPQTHAASAEEDSASEPAEAEAEVEVAGADAGAKALDGSPAGSSPGLANTPFSKLELDPSQRPPADR